MDKSEDVLFTKTIWDAILSSMGDCKLCDSRDVSQTDCSKNREGKSSKSKFEKTLHKLANPTRTYDTVAKWKIP